MKNSMKNFLMILNLIIIIIFNLFQLINWTKVSIELSNNLFELKIVTIYEKKNYFYRTIVY